MFQLVSSFDVKERHPNNGKNFHFYVNSYRWLCVFVHAHMFMRSILYAAFAGNAGIQTPRLAECMLILVLFLQDRTAASDVPSPLFQTHTKYYTKSNWYLLYCQVLITVNIGCYTNFSVYLISLVVLFVDIKVTVSQYSEQNIQVQSEWTDSSVLNISHC